MQLRSCTPHHKPDGLLVQIQETAWASLDSVAQTSWVREAGETPALPIANDHP